LMHHKACLLKKGGSTMKVKKYSLYCLFTSLPVVLAACGGANANNDGKNKDGEELEGSVVIEGSGTVYPHMSALAEEYMTSEEENVCVEVRRAGTRARFE